MEALYEYIPEDRRQALALGKRIADRSSGAALFADISGFTPLAETLVSEFGHRRGAEELTHHLNAVFDSLISALHLYGGSVVGFSGDAITCWLDSDTGLRAIASALEMQQRLKEFACVEMPSGKKISLAMKAAVACGSVRRFLVGDPERQVIDVLAGKTLDHLAEAEHLAERGEVILHPSAIPSTKDQIMIAGWREHSETQQPYCVVGGLRKPVQPSSWPELSLDGIPEEKIRPWLLPAVYQRLRTGLGVFLAELRPAVALFVRFHGIDYEMDEQAEDKLDTFIRAVERILSDHEGSLIQLTIGDKGSYLYAAFGAPIAHEDDAIRAVSAAQEIRSLLEIQDDIIDLSIGISQGRMRTGSYGGAQRQTYGVLGDEVNMAARLMQAAKPGQILGSHSVQESTSEGATWEALPKIKLKGFEAPTPVFNLLEALKQPTIHIQAPQYTLPMVGRENELKGIEEDLARVLHGQGKVIAITGEAGLGKSRFVAEVIRLSLDKHFTAYGGACQSYGTSINYLVWQDIYRGLFDFNPTWAAGKQIQALERALEEINPNLKPRLPLLSSMLSLSIPENDFTHSLDAKLRKTSLESLLVEFLCARAQENPLLLVLEDCHWIDDLSRDLLVEIGKAIPTLPVFVVLAYRSREMERLQKPIVIERASFREIQLTELSQSDIARLISLKLENLYGTDSKASPTLVESIISRSEGNPFYVEELLNYLRDRGIDPHKPVEGADLDLPDTLQSLILSRIDQLAENQKISLKVASIIGRVFRAAWLWGYYDKLGDPEQITGDLDTLSQLELLSLQASLPELTYFFKHILTQQVAYESLPFSTRATLHNQLGQFIESSYRDALGPYINLLAYHYEHSENVPKKRKYLIKAGESSQVEYANEAAINYYEKALPLLSGSEQVDIMKKLGQVLELVGRWSEAEGMYQQAIAKAGQQDDPQGMADCQTAMGEMQRKQGNYAESTMWLDRALSIYQEMGIEEGIGQVLHFNGTVAAQQGEYETARDLYLQSLEIRRRLKDQTQIASLLSNLGIVARFQGQYEQAHKLHQEALEIRRSVGDKWAIGVSLNNLGNVAIDQGDFKEARVLQEEGLAIRREVGDRWAIANALNNLGNLAREQGEFETAASQYRESMELIKDLDDQWAISYLLEDIGCLSALQGKPERALRLAGAASTLREAIGAPLSPAEKEKLDCVLDKARLAISAEQQENAYQTGRKMAIDQAVKFALEDQNTEALDTNPSL